MQGFTFGKSADVGFDFYRTDFQNQAVVDVLQSPQQVLFYNLKGNSYANSLQVEFNYELKSVLIYEQPINSMTFKLIICQEPIKGRCRQNIVLGI
jgi:hypothetical protein